MNWIAAVSGRLEGTGAINVTALERVLPLINMIETARGEPRSTLSDTIDRARHDWNDGTRHQLLNAARRQVEAQEAALIADWHNPPPEWQPTPEPVAKPQPRQLTANVTPLRPRQHRGGTYSYLPE